MKKIVASLSAVCALAMILSSCTQKGGEIIYQVPDGTDPITTHKWDRNKDGKLGFLMMKGEDGNPEAEARTTKSIEGLITVGQTQTVSVEKLAQQTMRDAASGAWNSTVAKNTYEAWANQYGKKVDAIISNNDGMAIAVHDSELWKKEKNKAPLFGFDALPTVLDAIIDGSFAGTISQNGDDQGYLCALIVRAVLDGSTINSTGTFEGTDAAKWNGLIAKMNHDKTYDDKTRNFGSKVSPVTTKAQAETLKEGEKIDLTSDTSTYTKKKIFVCGYKAGDDFLSKNVYPAIKKYAAHFNLEINGGKEFIFGDGTTDSKITDAMINLDTYDAFVINIQTNTAWKDYVAKIDAAKPGAPIVFYNRQPAKSVSGNTEPDETIADRAKTYFVGTAKDGQGEAQAQMVIDWFNANK